MLRKTSGFIDDAFCFALFYLYPACYSIIFHRNKIFLFCIIVQKQSLHCTAWQVARFIHRWQRWFLLKPVEPLVIHVEGSIYRKSFIQLLLRHGFMAGVGGILRSFIWSAIPLAVLSDYLHLLPVDCNLERSCFSCKSSSCRVGFQVWDIPKDHSCTIS